MRRALASAVAAALLVGLIVGVAPAAPKNARIVAVYDVSKCSSQPCRGGSDPALRSGDVVTGAVQIDVSAEADLGLEYVRLEAQYPGDSTWYCIELWNAQRATRFENRRLWHTDHWTDPREECRGGNCSDCSENSPHWHGSITSNLPHTLQLVAREQGSVVSESPDAVSAPFTIKLQNAPKAPTWQANPSAGRTRDGARAVDLTWQPNEENDIREYRFLRIDPSGARRAFAVDAERPEDQGCVRGGDAFYRCTDTAFGPDAPAGVYRYAIVAVRAAFLGERCQVADGRCIVGRATTARSVEVPGPTSGGTGGGPTPGATPGAPTASPSAQPTDGAPVEVDARAFPTPPTAPSGSGSKSRRTGLAALALVLVLAAGGGAFWRARIKAG